MTDQELVKKAFEMHQFSYVPYSHFPVGAALVSEGCREGWTAIAIAGQGEDYCWPCGACRQVLYEFAPRLRVLAARGDGDYKEVSLAELLPCGFGPSSLE